MGVKTLALYITSTLIACCVGLFFANTFQPGYQTDQEQLKVNRLSYEIWVNETEGVEFFDDIRLTEDAQFKSYLTDARETLKEQRLNEELNNKIAAASSSKNSTPSVSLTHISYDNLFTLSCS